MIVRYLERKDRKYLLRQENLEHCTTGAKTLILNHPGLYDGHNVTALKFLKKEDFLALLNEIGNGASHIH